MNEHAEHPMHHEIEQLVRHAALAPSSHNTQPWRFRIDANRIHLLADRARALPVNDPDDRELCISCGCALMNLRVAVAHAGFGTRVQRIASADQEAPLAVVELDPSTPADGDDASLLPYLASRRTYRKPFDAKAPPNDIIQALQSNALTEDCTLTVVTDGPLRGQVAELIGEGDRALWSNSSWRQELAAWMHPRRRGDGLTVPGIAAPFVRTVVRAFDMGKSVAAKDVVLAEQSPVLALLGTPQDRMIDWLRAGEALERVLLTACGSGLQASYLNQPIQVASLRSTLQELVAPDCCPQILLRLGIPTAMQPPSPRRPLADVLD